jgi:hypothetical protein
LVFAFLVFFAFLVCCTKKNLATLLENWNLLVSYATTYFALVLCFDVDFKP